MPLPRGLDPRMLAGLIQFNGVCAIRVNTPSRNSAGEAVAAWADFAGHTGLACNFYQPTGKRGGKEERMPDGTFLDAFSVCTIAGSYPDITEAMQLTTGGQAYNIMIASIDSAGIATTLTVELIR